MQAEDFDEGVLFQLSQKRSEEEALAALRTLAHSDVSGIQVWGGPTMYWVAGVGGGGGTMCWVAGVGGGGPTMCLGYKKVRGWGAQLGWMRGAQLGWMRGPGWGGRGEQVGGLESGGSAGWPGEGPSQQSRPAPPSVIISHLIIS